jgi:hypothetical protein
MMNSLENKIDDLHCVLSKKELAGTVKENAQLLVDNNDAPASLLGPLRILLNSCMHEHDAERLLTEGVDAVNRFFGEWVIISKLFFRTGNDGISEHTKLFREELVDEAYLTLAATFVGSIPAPIPKNCPGTLGENRKDWEWGEYSCDSCQEGYQVHSLCFSPMKYGAFSI